MRYPSFHGTDGFSISNCSLNGGWVGTFGLFFPYGNSGQITKVFTGNFTSVGQFILGGQWIAYAAYSSGNGGDGVVWGYDGNVDGNPQYAGNGGSGFHNVVGGSILNSQGVYHNRLHGIYIDGRGDPDWTAYTSYISQSFIRPTVGNPGNFVFFTQYVGTTGRARPAFCQTVGCTLADGTVAWVNAGQALGYMGESVLQDHYWTTLESVTCSDTGFNEPDGFVADLIRVEGTTANPVKFTTISSPDCHQSEAGDFNANGIHLLNVNYVDIDNVSWLGSGYDDSAGGSGLLLESAKGVVVSGMTSWFSYSNAIKAIHSNNSTFSGLQLVNTAEEYCS